MFTYHFLMLVLNMFVLAWFVHRVLRVTVCLCLNLFLCQSVNQPLDKLYCLAKTLCSCNPQTSLAIPCLAEVFFPL